MRTSCHHNARFFSPIKQNTPLNESERLLTAFSTVLIIFTSLVTHFSFGIVGVDLNIPPGKRMKGF